MHVDKLSNKVAYKKAWISIFIIYSSTWIFQVINRPKRTDDNYRIKNRIIIIWISVNFIFRYLPPPPLVIAIYSLIWDLKVIHSRVSNSFLPSLFIDLNVYFEHQSKRNRERGCKQWGWRMKTVWVSRLRYPVQCVFDESQPLGLWT